MAERHVLDTSALFCLMHGEAGDLEVARVLHEGEAYASFVSFMECFYVVHQEDGEAEAERRYEELCQLPLRVVESDPALRVAAGRLKATQRLSFADAWVAATAERLGAVLVHKDPEFDALSGRLRMLRLPDKTR